MNFKAFLKNNLISESAFLFEDGDTEQQKKTFIQSAYKRVYPNGNETDTKKQWNAVRSKAYYKLTKNSKPETRKAVQQAKGALNAGKTRFDLEDKELEDSEKEVKETSQKILDHLEDWTDEDFKELKENPKNDLSWLKGCSSLQELKDTVGTYPQDQDKVFELIKGQEDIVDGAKDWKDKTFDDLESIGEEEFNKIKDKLKGTLGVDDSVKLDSLDDLKNYLKEKSPDAETLQKLDALLDDDGGEAKQVPVQTTGQLEPQKPQENKVPVSTTNQEILDNIQKKQQEAELNDHLKKLGLDITSLDTGDTEVVQKIIDSGDPLLYDTYIAKNLPEESEIVQRIKREEEVRQQVQREALERRTDRFEELKKSGKVLAGIGVIFDVLASALSGKGTNFFETMAQKQTLAKGIAEGITNQLSDQYEERISNEDSNHAKELDALKTNYDQRLKDLESQKADPFKTVAYKKLLTMASQKYNEKKNELKAITQEASQRVAEVSSLQVFMSTDDFSVLDSTLKNQMTKVLSEKYPRQKIQVEDGTERDESDDEYLQRIKKEAKGDDIQRIVDDANNDLSMCKEKEKELNDSFTKSLEDLKQNPEVQDEMKLAEQTYKSQKAIIESEYKKAVATETTRYEKTVHCLRKTMDENKRFFKNISVLAMYSDNPEDIIMQEMASRNKKLQDRAKLETGTEIFNEENCPSDPKKLKEWFENASKGSEGKPKKGKDRDDDDDDGDDTPKKLKKPNDGDGTGGDGTPGTGGADGGKEPDPDEAKKKEQKAQTVADTKKGFDELKTKFSEKPNAQARLKKFLESKNLDLTELDNPEAMSEEDIKVFNDALKEFNAQKLEKWEDLKALGLKNGDKDYTDDELQKLFGDKEQLAKIKDEYGFDDDEGKAIPKKTEPLKVNTSSFEEFKKQFPKGVKLKINGEDVELTQENWDEYKENDEFKKYLETPEALKQLSNDQKDDLAGVEDTADVDDKDDSGKQKLSKLSLKTIWQKLNQAGISIRALPGYDPNKWTEVDKKNAIIDYMRKNPDFFKDDEINLTESKTSQKRLSSLIEANNKKIQKRSLKKFAELLVNDVRTFG